jgi:hypothetical protein
VARQSTTGNAPPTLPTTENAYWRLVAKSANTTVPSRLDVNAVNNTLTDANDQTETGWARTLIGADNTPYDLGAPGASNALYVYQYIAASAVFGVQYAYAIAGGDGSVTSSYSFRREYDNGSWTTWRRIYMLEADLEDYIPTPKRLDITGAGTTVTDANDFKVNGWARILIGGSNTPYSESVPGAPNAGFLLEYSAYNATFGIQCATAIQGDHGSGVSSYKYIRELDGDTWRAWKRAYQTIDDLNDAVPIFDNGHLTFSEPYSETIAASSPDTGVYLGRIKVGTHTLMLGANGYAAEQAMKVLIQKDYNSATAGSFDNQCVISMLAGDLYQVRSFHAVTVSTTEADLFLIYDIDDLATGENILRWSFYGNQMNRGGYSRPSGVTVPTLDASNDLVPKMKIRTSGVSFDDDISIGGSTALHTGDVATANNFKNNTADKLLETGSVWGAVGEITLTDAATISLNMADVINAKVTLGANRTLGNPFNTKAGQTGYIRIIQDATGSRTLSFGANWKFAGGVAPVLSTAANAVDMLFYTILPDGTVLGSLVKDVQ